MRAIKALAVAALVALDVTAATAQSTRGFKDSWFWGLKGGVLSYSAYSDPSALAPVVGADWLITRSKGGLYVGFDFASFNQSVVVNDSVHPDDGCPTAIRPECRVVNLKGMRRLTMAGLIFPVNKTWVQPYIGFGASVSHIASAVPDTIAFVTSFGVPFRNVTQFQLVGATVNQFRTAVAPLVMLGSQFRLPLVSAFGQLTVSPAHQNFLLSNDQSFRLTLEAGARYNIGSSIDRMR